MGLAFIGGVTWASIIEKGRVKISEVAAALFYSAARQNNPEED